MLDCTPNQLTKLRTKIWAEINDDARGTYNKDCQINFKIPMLKSSLCESKDAYTLVSVTITITGERADDNVKQLDKRNEGVIYKSYAPFTDCTNKINNAQTDNAKDLDVMIMMFNLIEYNDNFFDNIRKFVATLQRWFKWYFKKFWVIEI